MVSVVFCDLSISDLEGHHPSLTVAIEIWHGDAALNERRMNVRLVIKLLSFVHVLVKYENMLVTHDNEKFVAIERAYDERITEHL